MSPAEAFARVTALHDDKQKLTRQDREALRLVLNFSALSMAASSQGTSLGQWLYDALAEPFGFSGTWGAAGKAETRRKYNEAAKTFATRLAAALAEKAGA